MPQPNGELSKVAAAETWKPLLDADRWEILFAEGTERPGSSALNLQKGAGLYLCAACFQPLFTSAQKFDSGTGWPSFFDALPDALETRVDRRFFMRRTEYHCRNCGGHQGHVFDDGPPPTGLRYCNNGLALNFVAEGEPIPPRRGSTP